MSASASVWTCTRSCIRSLGCTFQAKPVAPHGAPSDVYTTIRNECGCYGHQHQSIREAEQCPAEYRRRKLSDRRAVAIEADAPWPPVEGRDLNDAELPALHAM